jgi:predicted metal-dependent hydrolase
VDSVGETREIPLELRKGITQFNDGDYFTCHETIERLWLAERGDVRRMYQGIIQLAAGLHHVSGGNLKGALALIERGTAKLEAFQPRCLGIDVAGLVAQARGCRATLASLGSDGASSFPWESAPKIHVAGGEEADR